MDGRGPSHSLEEDLRSIEKDMNEKLEQIGMVSEFFGSGHGVSAVLLMGSWIEREVAVYERQFGLRIEYELNSLPGGKSRFVVIAAVAEPDAT